MRVALESLQRTRSYRALDVDTRAVVWYGLEVWVRKRFKRHFRLQITGGLVGDLDNDAEIIDIVLLLITYFESARIPRYTDASKRACTIRGAVPDVPLLLYRLRFLWTFLMLVRSAKRCAYKVPYLEEFGVYAGTAQVNKDLVQLDEAIRKCDERTVQKLLAKASRRAVFYQESSPRTSAYWESLHDFHAKRCLSGLFSESEIPSP